MRKKIIAGNWKMNTSIEEGVTLAKEIAQQIDESQGAKVIVCPPFTHTGSVIEQLNDSEICVGAQNCHTSDSGAYTGEVSAKMLKSLNVAYCLVGHSERRSYFFEDNVELLAKIKQLLANDIHPIFCCGESLEDRRSGEFLDIIADQCELLWKLSEEEFSKLIIAYEPVWAIGTGETATAAQAQEVHSFIRSMIAEHQNEDLANSTSILYGGSCKPTNAKELFAEDDIDGGLIGGASLVAEDFVSIVNAL